MYYTKYIKVKIKAYYIQLIIKIYTNYIVEYFVNN